MGATPRAAPPERPGARTPERRRSGPALTAAALVLGLAVQAIPLVVFPTVLSQDGPAHVAGAWVLLHSGDDGATGALLREHYDLDLAPVPNMLATLLLAGLMPLLGPDTAERLLVLALVAGLVAALGYAVRGVSRQAGWLAVAALPLAGSHLVAYGFYNFGLGVAAALVALGLALRRGTGWSAGAGAALAGMLLLTWSAHLLPWAAALGGAVLLGLTRTGRDVGAGAPPAAAAARHVLPVVLAALPAGVLTVVYLASGDGPPADPRGTPSPDRLVALLAGTRPFVVGWGPERLPALVVVVALLVLALAALRRAPAAHRTPERTALGLLLAGAVLAAGLTPANLGAHFGFLEDRLAWFPVLLAALWAATRPPGPRVAAALLAVLVAAASAAALARLPAQAAAAREVAELLSVAEAVPPGSVLVDLQYDRSTVSPPGTPDPLRHESSRLAVRTGGVDVGHYEAVQRYFQVEFDGGPDLWRRMAPDTVGLERIPPRVRLEAVRGELDHVVVVGLRRAGEDVRRSDATRAVLAELEAHYTRVATSEPTGLVTVWRATAPGAG